MLLFLVKTSHTIQIHALLPLHTAKFTVNRMYWKNRDSDARELEGGWYSEISVNWKLKILAKRVNRLNLKSIGLLRSEKSSF